MKNSLTLTVGIPAYNEEANIIQLIDDILKQEYDGLESVSYTHLEVYKRQPVCSIA